jgi:hypothetical protein
MYTNVAKPTSSTYSMLNPMGKEQYDQPDIIYDSSIVYYDGVVPNAYTNLAKPVSSVYTKISKPT